MNLWTDGSVAPTNPGPGGWAVVTETECLVKGNEPNTTNIRMEGLAIIAAMKFAHSLGRDCIIRTDSQLWCNTVLQWGLTWKSRNWVKSNGQPVANVDLVEEALLWFHRRPGQPVRLVWVRGHGSNAGNLMADYWANKAREEGVAVRAATPRERTNCPPGCPCLCHDGYGGAHPNQRCVGQG
jgi:ribonuclease HI